MLPSNLRNPIKKGEVPDPRRNFVANHAESLTSILSESTSFDGPWLEVDSDCAMGPALVVELALAFDEYFGLNSAAEPFVAQQLVTQLTVEVLDEPVLPRAAWRDEGRTNCSISQPVHDLATTELCSDRTNRDLSYSCIIRDSIWIKSCDRRLAATSIARPNTLGHRAIPMGHSED